MATQRTAGAEVTSLLAPNVQIEGTLTGDGLVRLEGAYQGKIKHRGHLVIAETAVVRATVEGADITVHGRVEGDISATGRLELKQTAHVLGNVKSSRLLIADGASLVGACDVSKKEDLPSEDVEAEAESPVAG